MQYNVSMFAFECISCRTVLDYITAKLFLLYINTKDYKHTPLQDDQLGAHVVLLILVRDVIRTAFV